ncbi:MAG TPA: DUF1573 domain-containing protein, partial [Phnomibacter sp.]|nr:DUF1573 domain-containing protein [Phnomibacter sp.]
MKIFCSRWKMVIGVLFCTTNVVGQSPSPSLVFAQRVHHFGTIDEAKGKVVHTFEFVNNGKASVTIDEVHSGCGCIGNVVSKGAISPGGKGKVTVTF